MPQCIATNNVVHGKEISCALHKTFSARSTLIPTNRIVKMVSPNMSVSSTSSRNRVTNYSDWWSSILQKSFLESGVSCHPGLCMRVTSDLQLLEWLLLVKLCAFSWFLLVLYVNFLVYKIKWSMFFLWWMIWNLEKKYKVYSIVVKKSIKV